MSVAASVVGVVALVSVVGAIARSAVSESLAPKRNARIAITRTATAAIAVAAATQRQVLNRRSGAWGTDADGSGTALPVPGGAAAGGGSIRKPRGSGRTGLRVGRVGPSAGGIGAGGRKPGRLPEPRGSAGTPASDSSSMPAR